MNRKRANQCCNGILTFLILILGLLTSPKLISQDVEWQWGSNLRFHGTGLDTNKLSPPRFIGKIGNRYFILTIQSPKRFGPSTKGVVRCMIYYSTDGVDWYEANIPNNRMWDLVHITVPMGIVTYSEKVASAFFWQNFYKTTDGGLTWFWYEPRKDTTTESKWNGTLHVSPQNKSVLAVSSFATTESVLSIDSGRSKERALVVPQLSNDTGKVYFNFADDTTIICVFNRDYYELGTTQNQQTKFFRSIDQGRTWVSQGIPLQGLENNPDSIYTGQSIVFANTKVGYLACTQVYTDRSYKSYIYKTTDGGVTWQESFGKHYPKNKFLDDAYDYNFTIAKVFGTDSVVVVTDRGLVMVTYNGGSTWDFILKIQPKDKTIPDDVFGFGSLSCFFETPRKAFAILMTYDNFPGTEFPFAFLQLSEVTTSVDLEGELPRRTEEIRYEQIWLEDFVPHPSNGKELCARVYADNKIVQESIRYEIYDMYGSRVGAYNGNEVSHESDSWGDGWRRAHIPLPTTMQSGVYFLRYIVGTDSKSKAFLISQ